MGGYDNLNLNLCETSTAQGTGAHARRTTRTTTARGGRRRDLPDRRLLDLRPRVLPAGGSFPAAYDGALFFSDYTRDCIWVDARAAPTACPTRRNRQTFVAGAPSPVELQIGPGGDLYYVDLDGGTIRRVRVARPRTARRPRVADRDADRAAPRRSPSTSTARGSSDPDGDALTYAWDLDGDGAFDDSTVGHAEPHLHDAGHGHRRACASPTRAG